MIHLDILIEEQDTIKVSLNCLTHLRSETLYKYR